LQPEAELVERCREWAEQSGGKVLVTASAEEAVRDVDFIHTDVWVSMGEPVESWSERVGTLLPFQINDALVKAAGNPRVKVMHCLPAF
ncbi:ornithine carbamoyltransferase subunit F, partial [Xanthomonas citri pv. citri]|nr:ornithine carbamoyltransferase subunit F [Xanthomonas citri pv. citri]